MGNIESLPWNYSLSAIHRDAAVSVRIREAFKEGPAQDLRSDIALTDETARAQGVDQGWN